MHYLIEAGWRVEPAVQGLGRSNRTNQVSAPILRPCTTDVKGQKRFISTIARRLDALGAITRGQRQTGGQDCSGPKIISKATMPARRSGRSIASSMRAGQSRSASSVSRKPQGCRSRTVMAA